MVPIAAFAPMASMAACLSDLLLITATECPFCTNVCVNGLLMCPNEPVTMIFIFLFFVEPKFRNNQGTGVAESTDVVAKHTFNIKSQV
jgi:hypothetical protein